MNYICCQGSHRFGNYRYRSVRFWIGSVNYRIEPIGKLPIGSVSVSVLPKHINTEFCNNFGALWPNKTAFCSLSKVVRQVKIYQDINFYELNVNTCEVIRVFSKSTDLQKIFVYQQIQGVVSTLQLNETTFCSLSKVVHRVKFCQNINFHELVMNTCEVIRIFCKSTDF